MDIFINLIVVIISRCILNYHVVYFKYMQVSFVNQSKAGKKNTKKGNFDLPLMNTLIAAIFFVCSY